MPRAKPVPLSEGIIMSCMGHVKLGIVARSHGGIWVRKQGHKQIRCDREMREILAREWATVETRLSDRGRELYYAKATVDGDAAHTQYTAWRVDANVVDTSTVERSVSVVC